MPRDGLHVVFGVGQVGRALVTHLHDRGLQVRAVSLHRPTDLAAGIDWWAADATNPDASADAAKGAVAVYQCLNAPYAQWARLFPPLQRGVLTAATRNDAVLVSLENLYGYGPTVGPMTEDLPLAPTTVNGRTRAAMTAELLAAADSGEVRVAVGRASDFFGAAVTDSTLGKQVFANALAGKRADFLGNPDLLHTYSYVPDIAAGLATLGTDDRAVGQVWHLPGPETVTTRRVLEIIAADVKHPVGVRSVPKLVLRAWGAISPTMRSVAEMTYQFEEPFVLDTTKYRSTFGGVSTSLDTAISETLRWYRTRAAAA
jgi:nucleoside-diphosphate-sugar epimerase